MLISLAWKNIWRNKKRSLIILIAIILGLWAGLFASAVMFGMWDSAINSAIERDLSHIQIHTKEFKKEKLITSILPEPGKIISELKSNNKIASFAQHVVIEGMAASPSSSSGVNIIGIDPGAEKNITSISSKVTEGNYFKSKMRNPVVVGKELAKKLSLRLKSKIILSFQAPDGTITYAACRIAGIYKSQSSNFDKSTVFVKNADLYKILNVPPFVHEILIKLKDPQQLSAVTNQLKKQFPNLSVQNWKKIAPELDLTYEMLVVELYVFLGIILFALLFGVTNTMLMSVLDRIRELGVLLAVGMKRLRIFKMIIYETVMLSLVGGIIGMIVGALTILYFASAGINLSIFADAFSSFGISTQLYPELPASFYPMLTVMIIITAVLASIYPAIKAIKLQPASAIRTYA